MAGTASPSRFPTGIEKIASWTTKPATASQAQRIRSRGEVPEPAAEQEPRDQPDRDGVDDEHGPSVRRAG